MKFVFLFMSSMAFTIVMGCSSSSKNSDGEDNFGVADLNSGYEYYSAENQFYIGPQPNPENIKELKSDHDVGAIINLRSKRENSKLKFDAKKETKSVGINYYEVPLMRRGKPRSKALAKIQKILDDVGDDKVLIHCSSGNRAAAWYTIHRALQTKMTTPQAMEIAKNVGLQNRKLSRQLTKYFEKNGVTEPSAPEPVATEEEDKEGSVEEEAAPAEDAGDVEAEPI